MGFRHWENMQTPHIVPSQDLLAVHCRAAKVVFGRLFAKTMKSEPISFIKLEIKATFQLSSQHENSKLLL